MVPSTAQFQTVPNRLRRPRCPADVIPRSRLLQLLDPPARLTFVIAPAGYGKTTLICNWLESSAYPAAWISLAADDSDLWQFLKRMVAAMQVISPTFGQDLLEQFDGSTLPSAAAIAEILYQAIAGVKHDFVLVLDDYHLLGDSQVHALVVALLKLRSQHLHLVILARHDPPLPLAALRLHERIAELRSADLRFTESETLRMFTGPWLEPLDNTEIGELVRGTEGWVMSLRLAKLYLLQEQGFASLGKALDAGAFHAMEFLSEEVFAQLPQHIRAFLMRTAVLEQLCAAVCVAVSGGSITEGDAQTSLLWLEKNGVFTVALDETRRWFQYHALFRRLITQQMGRHYTPDQIADLHRLASQWYASNGLTAVAIRHALAAGDRMEALRLFTAVRLDLVNAQEWSTLEQLVRLFPQEYSASQPLLLLTQLWIARSQSDTVTVRTELTRLEALLAADAGAPNTPQFQGEFHALKLFACYWSNDLAGAIRHGLQSLVLAPQEATYVRGFAVAFLCLAYQMNGEWSTAYKLLEEQAIQTWVAGPREQMHLLTAKSFVQSLAGELTALRATADQMLELASTLPWTEESAIAYHMRAFADYAQNDLEAVVVFAPKLLARRYQVPPRHYANCAYILALAYHTLGRVEEAGQVVTAAMAYIEEMNADEYTQVVDGLRAALALREGRVDEADHLLRKSAPAVFMPMMLFYDSHMTLARLYLRRNTVESLRAASDLLDRIERFLATSHSVRFLIETLALKALYLQRCGQEEAALETMERSLHLAEPGGYIRIFSDIGAELLELLKAMQNKGVTPLLTAAILESLVPSRTANADVVTAGYADLAVILTFREQEVLHLLGERLTNQEIGARLNISPETVKRHSVSIFRKLNVKNRRAAALAARDLLL